MKNAILCFVLAIACLFVSTPDTKAQSAEGWFAALDTLTNVDSATYVLEVTGPKHNVSFQVNVVKISGTVGGNINIYGSIDGTNYLTTAIATQLTVTNGSANYSFTFGDNRYKRYKIVIAGVNGGVFSQRTYFLYRKPT